MQFGILGALQVTRDGAPVPLPGRVLPRLLAVLLLEAEHVVTLPKLIEAVWDERPPATARRQIQNTVAAIRGLLHGESAEVETVGAGYALRVRPEQVDSLRFQAAVRIAGEQVAASEPEAALRGLREALGWWRGPALAGLSGSIIEAGARLWDEERAAAEEDRAELELALNTGAPVIADLRRVLAEHPYRQHTAELLMTALYRAERAPEALDVYEAMRRRLRDELGIDPGQRLRELHTAILRDDPEIGTPKASPEFTPTQPLPAPAQLPADSVHFTGRGDQLAELDRLTEPGPSVAVLSGIGGSGKSTLALHWAHRVREHFPDGQLYVDLRGFDHTAPLTPLDGLAGFLRSLGLSAEAIPPDVDKAAELLRSRLANTQTLLVIDNARDAGQVLPLLPVTAGCAAVVTSRLRLPELAAFHDVLPMTVDSLDTGDALRFLTSLVGAERMEAEPEAARRLAALCAGLPLALRIVGTNLAARPAATLADTATELSDRDRLSRLAVEGDPTTTVAAAFDLSYQALLPDEQLMYLNLALLPGADFSEGLAIALADRDPQAAERTLDRLVAAHRVEEYRPGRYRFHDLVREYARRRAEDTFDAAELQRLREQAVDWYATGSSLLPTEEYRNIVATFLEWNGHPTVSRLLTRLIPFADAGYRDEPGETGPVGDDEHYRVEPADSVYELPELAAVAERGIATGKDSDDPMDAVRAYALADAVAYAAGDLPRSMRYAQKTLEALKRTPHGDRTGKARNDLGTTLTQLGRYREAVSILREAVVAANRSGRPHVQVEVLTSLGSVLRRMGIFAESETLLLRARDIDAASEGGPTTVYPLLSLSELYIDMGRIAQAEETCQVIAEMLRDHPSKYYRSRLYFYQAAIHLADHDHVRAEAALSRGLELVEETNSWRHQLVYTYRLAELLVDTGQIDRAGEALDRVAELGRYHTSETLAVHARVLCKLHTRAGDAMRAVKAGRQAVDVFAAMPDPLQQARSLTALAAAYTALGDTQAAANCRTEAEELNTLLGVELSRVSIGADQWQTETHPSTSMVPSVDVPVRTTTSKGKRRPGAGHYSQVELPVTIWLGDGTEHDAVERALAHLLEESGLEPIDHEPPESGSWFRRFKARTRDATSHLTPEQIAAEIERKLRIEIFDKTQATIDNQQASGAAALIAALAGEQQACIRVGSLLVIKVDGQIMATNLAQHQLAWLERNQTLLLDPTTLMRGLTNLTDSLPRAASSPVDRAALGKIAKIARRRAAQLEQDLLGRWPSAWTDMDNLLSTSHTSWPEWCLLPTGASARLVGTGSSATRAEAAALAALYAHRYAGTVWLVEPDLTRQLVRVALDHIELDHLTALPEWCVYLAAGHADFPCEGVWIHLDHDARSGRRELRLLLDLSGEGGIESLLPVQICLDRSTAAEIAANVRVAIACGSDGALDASGISGEYDKVLDDLSLRIGGLLAITAYLARPEADITGLDDPNAKPIHLSSPVRDGATWLVGYMAPTVR